MRERLQGFVTRIGGMLVTPRQTLADLLNDGRGGLADLVLLLGLQLLAVQLPRLTAAVLYLVQVSYAAGMSALLNIISQAVVVQLIAVLVATVLFNLVTRGRPGRARSLDLVSLALVPSVCLQLVVSLVVGLLQLPPGRWLALALLAVGGIWFLALWGLGVQLVRQPQEGEQA